MIRDTFKDNEHFLHIINQHEEAIKNLEIKFNNNQVNKINLMGKILAGHYYQILIAKYSIGEDMLTEEIMTLFDKICYKYNEYWELNTNNISAKVNGKIKVLPQYGYTGFLHYAVLLSLAVLLNVSCDTFNKLVDIINKDQIKDFFYEFLIKSRNKDRPKINKESYSNIYHINERLSLLKEAALEEDSKLAEEKLKLFLDKYWYKSLKGTITYNQHKKKNGLYNGYWCFPVAAIVKIKGLDDSSFKDNPYYPKDLVK